MWTPSVSVRVVTTWSLVLNLCLSAAKCAAGFLFSSQACLADGIHSFSDSATDLAVIIGERFWSEPADANHPHGHQRIEALITVCIGIALGVVGIQIFLDACRSFTASEHPTPGWPVFFAALASVLFKEWLFRWTLAVGKKQHSPATIANAWHHRSDALSSLPVAASTLLCRLFPGELSCLDTATAAIVSIFLSKAAFDIAWPAIQELSDRGAEQPVREKILAAARKTDGVCGVHDLRTRRLGDSLVVDIHILVDPELPVRIGHDICNRVTDHLMNDPELRIIDVLTHLEPWNDIERAAAHTENTP